MVSTRVPLDIDLEDRLVFGLSPLRFAYLALGAALAFTAWSRGLPLPLALPCAGLALAMGAGLAWGRWRGRPYDLLALDAARFAWANFALEPAWRGRLPSPAARLAALRRHRARQDPGRTIAVAASEPGAGASRVALEMSVAMALGGRRVALHDLAGTPGPARRALAGLGRRAHVELSEEVPVSPPAPGGVLVLDLGRRHVAPPADLTLLVVPGRLPQSADIRRERAARGPALALVLNRHRGDPLREPGPDDPDLAAVIPEDHAIEVAEASGLAALIAFPTSPAAEALRSLAASVGLLPRSA